MVSEKMGKHEFISSHYRRFIDPKIIKEKLKRNFKILYFKQGINFAKYKRKSMGFKNNSKEKVDKNFALAVNILNKNKIKYWICHGTLLGIIRDNQLIPWDHDIDIAVWSSNNLKNKIKKIMLSKKFTLKEKYLIEDDLLTFINQEAEKLI